MFQPWFVELISVLSNAIVGLSAVALAALGFIGLRQWRTELTGKAKFEVARKMAILSFQYRDEFKRARNPFTFPGESADRQRGDDEMPQETQVLDEYFARRKRLEPLQETLRKLYEANWEAEIILDKNIDGLIEPIEVSFKELFASIETYFHTQHNQARRRSYVESEEWLEPHFRRVYGTGDDEISQTVDNAVKALVDGLKSYTK